MLLNGHRRAALGIVADRLPAVLALAACGLALVASGLAPIVSGPVRIASGLASRS